MATRRHLSIGDRGMPAMMPSVCWSRGACGDDFFRGFNGDRYVMSYIYIYLVGGLNPSEKYDDSIFHRENDYIPKLVFPH